MQRLFLRLLSLLLPAILTTSCLPSARAQGLEHVKANYTKYEYKIPMRDGKRLLTAVYVPKDQSQNWPIMMTRTPYSVAPYGVDQYRTDLGPSPLFGKDNFIFVYQDVRGRWMSEGDYVNMRPQLGEKHDPKAVDESTDTYDTIDWLVKHVQGHNGKVGMWGISYPGFYTAAGIIDAHPALACASPQAPIVDWFVGDDFHHNGALMLPHFFNFISKFGRPRPAPTKKFDFPFDHGTPDGYQYFLNLGPLSEVNPKHLQDQVAFWKDVIDHPNYDEFWQARNLRPHLKNIRPAIMTVGGWFDAENLFGALETYRSIESSSPKATNTIVMGPWSHGQWSRDAGESLGDAEFNAKTAEFYREKIELPFFQFHLKGKPPLEQPEAWMFESGTNQWRKYDHWPPKNAQTRDVYLSPQHQLSLAAPAPTTPADEYDEYVSDPARPVPFIDWIDIGMSPQYMVADQRHASRRPDVLDYKTEVLEADMTLAGAIEVELTVSTSGTDSDWVVKLIDVYPDDEPDPKPNPTGLRRGGFQQLVRGDVFRGKYRDSFTTPQPFVANQPTTLKFTLRDVYHAFRTGHRMMVQVQSSWFPLVDRNPQVFTDIYRAKPADFQKATQRVYHSAERPSHLTLHVLP